MVVKYTPYDWQQIAIEHIADFFNHSSPGDKRIYSAPTGCGKSIILLKLLDLFPNLWIITPRIEIIAGMLEKLGYNIVGYPESAIIDLAWLNRITTPIRLRNHLMKGFELIIEQLAIDESHHAVATTYEQLDILVGQMPSVGLTATPFRGTPRETRRFREIWGEPIHILDYEYAIKHKYISFPSIHIRPLVDDDEIEVVNGEFVIDTVSNKYQSKMYEIEQLLRSYYQYGRYDRLTMLTVSSTVLANFVCEYLNQAKLPIAIITAETPTATRQFLFQQYMHRYYALVQINVISEGVDLPIRRIIDLAPIISPVKFLQQFGRITRPVNDDEPLPEYICTNRNILRHAYLFDGVMPHSAVVESELAFDGPSKRQGGRVIGFENIGRFKAIELPLANGLTGLMYAMSTVIDNRVIKYAALAHPLLADPIWAIQQTIRDGEVRQYGEWQRCDPPENLRGYTSLPPSPLTDKQRNWWKRQAKRFGLNPDAKITNKNFQALPVLYNLGVKFCG